MEHEILNGLIARSDGAFHLRLLLQPTMALVFAVIDGRKDAATGEPPYLWALLSRPGQRRARIKSAWEAIGKVFVVAIILDCLYQYVSFGSIKLTIAVLAALILCALPYTVVRGPISRLSRMRSSK
ncbi:hypothetical protein K3727_21845 (plasmid) [Rhodobacteraceae bacterium M382]|nr:hypothetical protein K3727_21845 [Rhodobacteraceae bacterium M382]